MVAKQAESAQRLVSTGSKLRGGPQHRYEKIQVLPTLGCQQAALALHAQLAVVDDMQQQQPAQALSLSATEPLTPMLFPWSA